MEGFFEQLHDAEQKLNDKKSPESRSAVVLAFNNLSVTYLRQNDLLMARFWASQALDIDPGRPATAHNVSIIEARLRSFAWPDLPSGTYLAYLGCGLSNEIRITESSSSTAKVRFDGIRIGAGARRCHSFPAAVGELESEIEVRGKTAVYRGSVGTASCKIQLEFGKDGASVDEEGDCGFGVGVHTTGDYQRVSVR